MISGYRFLLRTDFCKWYHSQWNIGNKKCENLLTARLRISCQQKQWISWSRGIDFFWEQIFCKWYHSQWNIGNKKCENLLTARLRISCQQKQWISWSRGIDFFWEQIFCKWYHSQWNIRNKKCENLLIARLRISCQQKQWRNFEWVDGFFVFGCGLFASTGNLLKILFRYCKNWLKWVICRAGKWTEITVTKMS